MNTMFTIVVAAFAITTSGFKVYRPKGPEGSGLVCGSYAYLQWDAEDMPSETDSYDVDLYTSNRQNRLKHLIERFPSSSVGFAQFYPDAIYEGHGNGFVVAVVAKDKRGAVLETSYSPIFDMPFCGSESSISFSTNEEKSDSEDDSKSLGSKSSMGPRRGSESGLSESSGVSSESRSRSRFSEKRAIKKVKKASSSEESESDESESDDGRSFRTSVGGSSDNRVDSSTSGDNSNV